MNLMYPLAALCALVATLLYASGRMQHKYPSEPFRSHTELCKEVAYELGESVKEGMMTKEEADSLTKRCYEVFVK